MKKYIIVICLGFFFISCKSKKTTIHSGKLKNRNAVSNKKEGVTPTANHATKENGKFIHFKIESASEYIETFSGIAQIEMESYGIPASITLAQGLLESGYGKGELALKTNNHFGIKCHTGWEGDFDFHDDDEKGECFRKYNHPKQSYRDHSIFLTTRSRYSFLFDYSKRDYKSWAKGLRRAGYATDVKYPQKLIYLIEKHKLYQFDTASVSLRTSKKNTKKSVVEKKSNKKHIVQKGDTLYSISKTYFVSVEDLKKWNNMKDSNLAIGQVLRLK